MSDKQQPIIKVENVKSSFFNLKTLIILIIGAIIASILFGLFSDNISKFTKKERRLLEKENKNLKLEKEELIKSNKNLLEENKKTLQNVDTLLIKYDSLSKASIDNREITKKIRKEYEEIDHINNFNDQQLIEFFTGIEYEEKLETVSDDE